MNLMSDSWTASIYAAGRLVNACECVNEPMDAELLSKMQAAQLLFPDDRITVTVERKYMYSME